MRKKPKKSDPDKLYPVPPEPFPKLHPWRICPLGQHWVREHERKIKPTRKKPFERTTSVAGHCRDNPTHKDRLYPDEMDEIKSTRFPGLRGKPDPNDLGYKDIGNQYDYLIRGWTRYWNDVLKPSPRLDPNLVKALIGSESSFDPKMSNHQKGKNEALGLMQVTKESVEILKNEEGELQDHLINIDQDDRTDPNLNIATGIRWLFQKRRLASGKLGRQATWEETVAEYKGYDLTTQKYRSSRGWKRFRDLYDRFKK